MFSCVQLQFPLLSFCCYRGRKPNFFPLYLGSSLEISLLSTQISRRKTRDLVICISHRWEIPRKIEFLIEVMLQATLDSISTKERCCGGRVGRFTRAKHSKQGMTVRGRFKSLISPL